MTYTEQIKSILEKSGVDTSTLPDNLYSTLLNALLNAEMGGGGLTREEVEKIVTDEVSKIVADAPEDFDTLKEMSDWISQHEDSAAAMNSAIQQNATDISTLKNDSHTHTNKTVLDGITQVQLDKIDTNETNISTLKKHVTGELTDSDFQEDSEAVSVKTVPSGVSNYAAISKIGGKTVKGNLFNINGEINSTYEGTVVTANKNVVSGNNVTPATKATLTHGYGQWIPTKPNTYYTATAKNIGTAKGTIRVYCTKGSSDVNGIYTADVNGVATLTFKATGTETLLTFQGYDSIGAVFTNIQFEEGSVAHSYVPYGQLWSAPVESVVSVGKNRIIKSYYDTILGSDGRLSADTHYNCFAVECVAGQKYNITADATVYAFYETLPTVGTTFSYDHSRVISGSLIGITAPITGYLVFRTQSSYKYPACTLGDVPAITVADYIEPHKTTLLVPSEARNCVGYGLGISDSVCNIVDFENGVYTQMLNEIDLGSLTWNVKDSSRRIYSATLSDSARYTDGSVIPSMITGKYTTVGHGTSWTNGMISMDGDSNVVCICDTAYASVSDFQNAMNGQKLVYKLASTVTKALTNFIRPLPVENGGTITLQNEHSLDVPNTVVFKKEVSLS